jgi:hypothetical protein
MSIIQNHRSKMNSTPGGMADLQNIRQPLIWGKTGYNLLQMLCEKLSSSGVACLSQEQTLGPRTWNGRLSRAWRGSCCLFNLAFSL